MHQIIEWHDSPLDSEYRKILTFDQLHIPGLTTFGYHYSKKATNPLRMHYHKDCIEITYVVKGSITFLVGDTPYKLYGGDILITSPNSIHSTGNSPIGLCELYWLQLNTSYLHNFLELREDWGTEIINNLLNLGNITIKQTSHLLPLIKSAFDIFYENKALSFRGLSQLVTFLHELVGYAQITSPTPLSFDIYGSIDYIISHISEDINLEHLASLCHLSLSRFKQKFTAEIGISPREFINQQKIELAKTLLTEKHNMTDIALEIGFSSSSYFSVVFKRYTGMSPSEYIKHSC